VIVQEWLRRTPLPAKGQNGPLITNLIYGLIADTVIML
jgi:hypothetical protein